MPDFRIHGDNIVECERTLEFIASAIQSDAAAALPSGSPLTPTYELTTPLAAETFRFTFLPGYGRWDHDILEVIRRQGGCLREAADAIVCRVEAGAETPILAIEYCGALPAGNQAWQRNGRALSFAHAQLPYFYIAELSGYELDANRRRKAARLPNPAVPFSYLILTESRQSPALPAFVRSPGASIEAIAQHSAFYGEREFLEILQCLLLDTSPDVPREALEAKVLGLTQYLANTRSRNDTLRPNVWAAAFTAITGGQSLPSFLAEQPPMAWSKTAYIDALTATAQTLMTTAARFARGLTSSSLPFCLVLEGNRNRFADELHALYPALADDFSTWCRGPGHLAICWVMGFKPRGDDARPDRGLPPFCRMLVGDATDMLTVVYGPAPASTWPMLEADPAGLMQRNGLWEAVLVCSDAVLVDASTLPSAPPTTYLKAHWAVAIAHTPAGPLLVTPNPLRASENDVDTVLHLLFSRLARLDVFEGMCNPPGGDWSGMSLLTNDRKLELRWLGLPRVTAREAKRPDHVFQIFDGFSPALVLVIESKELARDVESNIGPRLIKYVQDLINFGPSVQRAPGETWHHATDDVTLPTTTLGSAAAFVLDSERDLASVAKRASADVVFGCAFSAANDACTVHVMPCTPLGKAIAAFVASLRISGLQVDIRLHS